MDLKAEYKKQTNKSPYVFDEDGKITSNFSYKDTYVHWLENKIKSTIDELEYRKSQEMKYKFRPFGNPNNYIELTTTGKVYESGEHPIYKDHKIIEVIDKDGHVHDAFLDELEVESETLEEAIKKLYPDNIIKLGNETSYNAALIKRKDFIQGVKWKLRQGIKKLYSEEEVRELLETQRGNCYVALLHHTKNDDIASVAINAPEPGGKNGTWVK